MSSNRANNVRERIKNGITVSSGDVAHLALNELEQATKETARSMEVAQYYVNRAHAYARIAQALKKGI